MVERVHGKIALVTGGALGQGASHVELLAREGARVLFGDVLDEEGRAVEDKLQSQGLDVAYCHLDVTKEDDWASALQAAQDRFGLVDVLVNNAGIGGRHAVIDCTVEEWRRITDVDQMGVLLGMRAVLPGMTSAGRGSIINVASQWGHTGGAEEGYVAYVASKAAVYGLTRNAALCYGPSGVRVNAVSPGMVNTRMLGHPDRVALELSRAPLRRWAEPIEISYAVLYLASDEASYVTGIDLVIDGGLEVV